MMPPYFALSAPAKRDIVQALRHYLARYGEQTARGFHRTLVETLKRLAIMPGMGSPRWMEALGIPGLRFWPLRRYPMHLFYNDGAMPLLLLLRVLHERMKVQRSTLMA